MRQQQRHTLVAGGLVALALALGACTGTPPHADPARTYGAQARLTTFQVDISQADATQAQPLPAAFVEEYYRRGRGPMAVVMPAEATPEARAAAIALADWLRARQVPTELGRSLKDGAGTDTDLSVSFRAYVALVPECGDWSNRAVAGIDPSNHPDPNFGCAYHRNIGMMLSDPGELLGAQATGPADTPRLVDAIKRHRTGAAVGAQMPTGELTTIQVER